MINSQIRYANKLLSVTKMNLSDLKNNLSNSQNK